MPPINATLRRISLLFRLLGVTWMLILVVVTLANDGEAARPVVVGAGVLALLWTGVTAWAAQSDERMRAPGFGVGEVLVVLVIGAAPTIAGADELFHGGYLTSSIAVIAYGWGMTGALAEAGVIGAEQLVVHLVDDRGPVAAVGTINFIVVAVLIGWAYGAVRDRETRRLQAQDALADEQRRRVRFEERSDLADRLHDSVLQTLEAVRREADDCDQVRYLARRQERQLRHTIEAYRSPFDNSARAALLDLAAHVEDVHRIEVDAIVRGDCEVSDAVDALMSAVREAMTNAAKHAGVNCLDLYSELDDSRAQFWIRDRGHGMDTEGRARVASSLARRVAAVGGDVEVRCPEEGGVEVIVSAPLGHV